MSNPVRRRPVLGTVAALALLTTRRAQDPVLCAQLVVTEFNESGSSMAGQKAELMVRDDKLDPGEAATGTLELIEKDRMGLIVGSLSASVQLAVNNVTR